MSASETGSLAPGSASCGRFRHNRPALLGLILVGLLTLLAFAAPLLPLADPYAVEPSRRMLPLGAAGHLLGTDQLGRDLLSRLVWGTRSSLAVGLFAVLIATLLGTLLGLVAGYFRGVWDALLMRGMDILLAFPYLLLALAIVAALGPGLRNAMIAIAVVNIPLFARTVRGTVIGLSEREFIAAARLSGQGHTRILLCELLPNVLPVVVVMVSTNLGWMILETAGLSFLGLGAQPPSADLGSMLGASREFLTTVPRVALLPGGVILLLVIGINLVGDGLRDLLDPRLSGEQGRAADPTPVETPQSPCPQGAGPLLRVNGLSTGFRAQDQIVRIVDDVSFELGGGERLAVVGESGSGKTVTALTLLGLVTQPGRIVAGEALFEGEDLLRVSETRRRQLRGSRIAYIPQDPMNALNPVLSIGEQLVETLRAHQVVERKWARRQAVELLDRVRIARPRERLEAYPHELSGGMRQRVMIAMALANQPTLLIADEATSALDVTVQAEVIKLMDELCEQRHAALIFISHDLAVALQLCNRVLVFYAGQVVEEATGARLRRGPAHPYTRALLSCVPQLGRTDRPLTPVSGSPPQLDRLPAGCRFAPRCRYVKARCRSTEVRLRPFADRGRVRCLRAEEFEPWRR